MKKNLLEESQVRKMMKQGGVPTRLIESYIQENYYFQEAEEQFPEEPEMDMDEPEGGDMGDVDVEALVMAIADAITSTTGVDVEVEGSGADEFEDEEEFGGEDEFGGDDEFGGEDEFGDEDEDDLEALEESSHELSAGHSNQSAQGKPKPGSFERPKGKKMPQLEEADEKDFEHPLNKKGPAGVKTHSKTPRPAQTYSAGKAKVVNEVEEELDEYFTSQRRRNKGKGTKHPAPSAGGAKVVGEKKQRGREPWPDRVDETEDLDEGWQDEEPATRNPQASHGTGKAAKGTSYNQRRPRKKGFVKGKGYFEEGQDEFEDGDEQLDEMETVGGNDPNKFPANLQKEHVRAIAKEVVAGLLEQIKTKKR